MGETEMKHGKRNGRLLGILFWVMAVLFAPGCGGGTREAELEAEIRSRIATVLPAEDIIEEIILTEREKTRNMIRYWVHVKVDREDAGGICEKNYIVSYCRENGEWVCSKNQGVRLVEENVFEPK